MRSIIVAAIVLFFSVPCWAQSPKPEVQSAWGKLESEMHVCIVAAASLANTSEYALQAAGVLPSDPRLAEVMQSCEKATHILKKNFSCTVTRPSGAVESTYCDQVWEARDGGITQPISSAEAYRRAFNGQAGTLVALDQEVDAGRIAELKRWVPCGGYEHLRDPVPLNITRSAIPSDDLWDRQTRIAITLNYYAPYPEAALEAGEEGKVVLKASILPSGAVAAVSVAGSSGHKVLDESTIAFACSISPIRTPPPGVPPSNRITGDPSEISELFVATYSVPFVTLSKRPVSDQQKLQAKELDQRGAELWTRAIGLMVKGEEAAGFSEEARKLFENAFTLDPSNAEIAWHLRLSKALPYIRSPEVVDSYWCATAAGYAEGGQWGGDYPFDCRAGNTGYSSMPRGPERAKAMAQALLSSAKNVLFGDARSI